jgi:hypothetical protein
MTVSTQVDEVESVPWLSKKHLALFAEGHKWTSLCRRFSICR